MDAPLLTDDFKEFLRLLNANHVEYLLVGEYAVGLHGYPRATVDMDIWVRPTPPNGARVMTVLVIALADLKTNKKAAGRHKDRADLENLP
jgi:hypothetical protein